MSDYISRQAAIDIVVFECGKWTGLVKEISKQLKQLPAADVAPVRHGKWTHKPDVYGVVYCFECNYELYANSTSFCPNCGAKMDAQGEE